MHGYGTYHQYLWEIIANVSNFFEIFTTHFLQTRKKGHVIIPLRRCASEAIQSVEVKRLSPPSVKNSSNQRSDNPSGANGHHDLESDFFSQLAIIQVRKYFDEVQIF